ncbi:MAG: hypothetical protein K0B05_00045 [Bacteroidales bacterium]|nr:hypothetical protein [Bacteroidales bacterium]
MKKKVFMLAAITLITAVIAVQSATAQERSVGEKEKELRDLKELESQKKAQEKAQEKAMKEAEVNIEKATEKINEMMRTYRGSGRSFSYGEPFIFTPGGEFIHGAPFGGDSERTTWDFFRSVKGASFTKSYSFDVEKTARTVVMSVNGDCKSGEIRVSIIMPGGKSYSDIVIDEFGNLNWRKSFNITEEENKDKTGEWTFKISARNATGQFKISLQTY